jgi:hypothetical protein
MSYSPKTYRAQGGDEFVIASGGTFTAQAGATVDLSAATVSMPSTIDLDSNTATLVSNAATLTKRAVQITSEALTTAAGAAQAFTLTLAGVAATDLAFVQGAGGTNTREHIQYKAVCTTNTVTVTVNNIGPTNAINGTLIFNLLVYKA